MVVSLALYALIGLPRTSSGALKGAEAYQQLRQFETQFLKDARASGKTLSRDAEMEAIKQKATDLLVGVDVAAIPAGEGMDWSRVLDAATRYSDSLIALDRFLGSSPGPSEVVQAKLAEVADFRRTNQLEKATDLLTGLKPSSEADAAKLASSDAAQAAILANTRGEDAGLKFLDTVQPNFSGFDSKSTAMIGRERTALKMPATRTALIGKTAPTLSILPDKYGNFNDLADLKGKVVVLDFFAHWCPPCKASFPDMRALSDALGDKVQVLGVTSYYGFYGAKQKIDEKEEFGDMKQFMDEYKIDHPVLYVSKDEFAKYGVSGIPEFVLIGKDGNVQKIQLGYSKQSFVAFRQAVEEAAAK